MSILAPNVAVITRASFHALAILSGVLALVGLARTTVGRGFDETSERTALGYLAACWVVVFNGLDISALLYCLKMKEAPKRLPPYYRIAQHVVAIVLAIGGGILLLIPGSNSGGEWGGWDAWTSMAFVVLIIAAGFHYALFLWEVADVVMARLGRDSVAEPPKSAGASTGTSTTADEANRTN